MTDDPEPTVNISGGPDGGGIEDTFDRNEAGTRAETVIDRLGSLYWRKTYGGQDAFTCLVRTILSQNTSDLASQPAHDALVDRYGREYLAQALVNADRDELADIIRPAGLYNQKAAVIQSIANHVLTDYGSARAFDRFVKDESAETVRKILLDLNGIGPKTADCVLLFASGREGVFPVDTHVHRIFRRLGIAQPAANHEEVRKTLEREVPPRKCGFGHTASIQFGREYCTALKPVCLDNPEQCPLVDVCDQVGMDREAGTVVDPGETVSER